jgi:hypothetical protein
MPDGELPPGRIDDQTPDGTGASRPKEVGCTEPVERLRAAVTDHKVRFVNIFLAQQEAVRCRTEEL